MSLLYSASPVNGSHETRRPLHRVFRGQVIGEGAHVLGPEIETAPDAGIDHQLRLAALVPHHLDTGLDHAPALVLLLVADEHQHRQGELIDLRRISVDLLGLGCIGVLQVRIVGNVTGDVLLLPLEGRRHLQAVIAAAGVRVQAGAVCTDVIAREQHVHGRIDILLQFVVMPDRVRADEMCSIDIRRQHHEAACRHPPHKTLHPVTQPAPAVHEQHRRVWLVIVRPRHQCRDVHITADITGPLGGDGVIFRHLDLAVVPPGAVPPPAVILRLVLGACKTTAQQASGQQGDRYDCFHILNFPNFSVLLSGLHDNHPRFTGRRPSAFRAAG